ncbi:MAG: hypothetical protein L0332_20330 [Chloroflexi bacterium]|nr:hypothetical protein [Chloroflexota bacterium]MCI0647563.1 hypothetical protein [Chloroflexota bacterium]MCI0729045.1 hypothetical protein [Chloroflexota bacterium]
MLRRVLGIVMLLIGISGVALSVVGVIIGRQVVGDIGQGLETSLSLTSQSLDTVNDSLALTKTTVGQVKDGLETVEETAMNVSQTISDTRPLLDQVTQVATNDVPNGLEAVEATIPQMAEVAGIIDRTLRTLSAFRVERTILGIDLGFDLGVDYDPEVPFDESVNQIGESLEGMPERLRGLEVYMDVTNNNLALIGDNIDTIATDLHTINSSMAQIEPLLDDYIRLVTETNDLIRQTRSSMSEQLRLVKLGVTILFTWLGLTQIAPIYLGWGLLTEAEK